MQEQSFAPTLAKKLDSLENGSNQVVNVFIANPVITKFDSTLFFKKFDVNQPLL